MKIFVKAKPGARAASLERIDEGLFSEGNGAHFTVAVREPPRDGRANEAVRKAIAAYFHVPASHVQMISGHTSRSKVLELRDR